MAVRAFLCSAWSRYSRQLSDFSSTGDDDPDSWDFQLKTEEMLLLVKQILNADNLGATTKDLITSMNESLRKAIDKMSEKHWKANEHRAERQRTIERLKAEHLRFEERLNEKIAAKENMEDHSEEREVMLKSLQKEFLKVKQRFEKCKANIEKTEVLIRKGRMMFEQSLEKVVEALKNFWECLESEKLMAEADKEHLLSEGSFQEENIKAKEHLETTSTEDSDLQERCSKLRAELENLRVQDGGPEED